MNGPALGTALRQDMHTQGTTLLGPQENVADGNATRGINNEMLLVSHDGSAKHVNNN